MEFICLFFPALISIFIHYKINGKKEKIFLVLLYAIYNVSINGTLLFLLFIKRTHHMLFTVSFSFKYLLLALFLSIFYFALFNMINATWGKSITKIIKKIKNFQFKDYKKLFYFLLLLSIFFSFDYILRIKSYNIDSFYDYKNILINIIAITSICFFFPLTTIKNTKTQKATLILIYVFTLLLFLGNYFLLSIKEQPLVFNDLYDAKEGLMFINYLKRHINISIIFFLIINISIFMIVLSLRSKINFKTNKTNFKKKIIRYIMIYIFLILVNISCIKQMDNKVSLKVWEQHTNPVYYYTVFTNPNRNLQVMGLYEYVFADLYVHFKSNYFEGASKADVERLLPPKVNNRNEYTGTFKNKNLIMIMMESIDEFIIDKDTMPTLYKLRQEGWDFTSRYSQSAGGGTTIKTEFSSLTGLYFTQNHQNQNRNRYKQALPSMLKLTGYKTTSFHENKGIYYNRNVLHKNFGFDKSYFLYDYISSEKIRYFEDAQLVENKEIYELIVDNKNPFFSFIITISAHGPYDKSNWQCFKNKILNEKDCLKYLSNRTDKFLELLLKRLKEDKLLDDTVLLLYTDHYPYAYKFTEEEKKTYKKIDEGKTIKNLPFIIYNPKIIPQQFDNILIDDVDILPTVLNLFGIKYNPNEFVGEDIFSKDHKNIVIFSNGGWYDGDTYSLNQGVDYLSEEFIKNSKYVADKLKLNEMLIKSDFYNK